MFNKILFGAAVCGAFLCSQAFGGSVGLHDWCFNVNGASYATNACNGGQDAALSGVDLSAFDTTLADGTGLPGNGLGTAVFTLGPGLNQFVSFYADYDVDAASFGDSDDTGAVGGSLPAGWSYQFHNPNDYDQNNQNPTGLILLDNFINNTLDGSNTVSTPSQPPDECCDAAFAVSVGALNLADNQTATVSFRVASFLREGYSGFYLKQTNTDTNNAIYVTADVSVNTVDTGVPEPSTFGLAFGGLTAAFFAVRKRRRA